VKRAAATARGKGVVRRLFLGFFIVIALSFIGDYFNRQNARP